ncbi:MAG TPA: hypothetical protein VLE97_08670 [Gaiellaceae bacterium]|nr:hypothetical protein [Gaiellaceae bacterium]
MSENTTADKNPAPTDLPAPNGHASNGVTAHESQDSGNAAPSAASSVKKRKKKKPAAKAGASPAPAVSAEPAEQRTAPADLPPQQDPAAEATPVAAPTPADNEPATAEAIVEPSAPAADPVAAPATDPAPAVAAEAPAADAAPETAAPAVDLLRLRMKVWTDPGTGKRFLMPSAFMRDVVNGQPVSDVMYAYAMSDEETKLVLLRAHEWNTLPFYYFYEDGPAPRASSRPVDVIVSGGRTS